MMSVKVTDAVDTEPRCAGGHEPSNQSLRSSLPHKETVRVIPLAHSAWHPREGRGGGGRGDSEEEVSRSITERGPAILGEQRPAACAAYRCDGVGRLRDWHDDWHGILVLLLARPRGLAGAGGVEEGRVPSVLRELHK